MQFSRDYTENEAPGAVFYSAAYVTGKKQSGFGEWLQVNKFHNKALTPAIDWKKSDLEKGAGVGAQQACHGAVVGRSGQCALFGVCSAGVCECGNFGFKHPCGISAQVSYKTTYTMPDDKKSGYNYAVCVLDRYGNEYEPVYYGQSGVECIGETAV